MKYLSKTIEYGLYLLVFLLPLQTRWVIKAGQLNGGAWEYGTYSLYGTDILLIAILVLYVISLGKGFEKGKMAWFFAGGLALISAISIFFAIDKYLALYKFYWLALGLGLFWLITSADYKKPKLVFAMLGGVFLSAALGIWQFLFQATFANKWLGLALHRAADLGVSVVETVGADGIGERWLRAYGSLDHPNMFGGLIAIGLLFLIGEIITGKMYKNFQFSIFPLSGTSNFQIIFNEKIFKFLNWFILLVFTIGLFFSFSRSAWLALIAGLITMIILTAARGNLKFQKTLAEIILVMGILLFILFNQYQNLITTRLSGESRLEIKSTAERLASYHESWSIIKKHWLIGVGTGNYTLALRDEFPVQGSFFYQPAHNAFVLIFSETGFFGLVFFLGLIIYLLTVNLRRLKIKENDETDNPGLNMAILIALLVLMFFDHWLFSLHFGVLFFWLMVGLVGKKRIAE